MEHHLHTLLDISPFEAAHGLPARSAAQTLAEVPVAETRGMRKDDIQVLQEAAKATITAIAIEQLRRHDKEMTARLANANSNKQTFRTGDKVTFYIPPSKPEKEKQKKKGKHILQYRGPAEITRVRTPTTYDLEFCNRNYSRELRPYKQKHVQW